MSTPRAGAKVSQVICFIDYRCFYQQKCLSSDPFSPDPGPDSAGDTTGEVTGASSSGRGGVLSPLSPTSDTERDGILLTKLTPLL